MSILNNINEEILGVCEVSEIGGEIEEAALVTDRILNTKSKIEAAKKAQNTANVSVVASSTVSVESQIENSPNTDDNTSNNNASHNNTNTTLLITTTPVNSVPSQLTLPKLPKLELSKFSGKVTEWSSFWDLYNTAIHSNVNMSKVNKFNYLFSLLERNAARSIKGLT